MGTEADDLAVGEGELVVPAGIPACGYAATQI